MLWRTEALGPARTHGMEFAMGFRRRTRRRALIAGAAVAHHEDKKYMQQQAPAESYEPEAAPAPAAAPAAADPADEIEHLAQLHASGVLTDDEFASAKAKILGS